MTLRVSCLGDSVTRAQFSADYLVPLARRHRSGDIRVERFGVNGDFAYNLLQRLDRVLTTQADVVTVLIGTNDARASLAGYPVEKVMKRKHLPRRPSTEWFQECLGAVVQRLRAETDATIALLTLPVLGQDVSAPAARASEAYSQLIVEVATAQGVTYLPLHERQVEHLRRTDAPPIPYREATPAAVVGTLVQRSVLRRDLDAISRRRGLVLTTDHIHQNSRGAALIAEVIDRGVLTATAG